MNVNSLNILYRLTIFVFTCVFAVFSPALAAVLLTYSLVIFPLLSHKNQANVSILTGLLIFVTDIYQFDLSLLSNLWQHNIYILTNFENLGLFIRNSFISFRLQVINDGLLAIGGIPLVILGVISYYKLMSYKQLICSKPMEESLENFTLLGYDNGNKVFKISHAELNQHTLVIGTTGSGKTSTLLNIVYDCCLQNLPLIYLDGKGSIKLVDKISQICDKFGRKLKIFSIDPGQNIQNLAKYNPLAYGNFTEWKNKIATLLGDAENKGQEHYAIEEQSYINLVCEILNKSGKYIDFEALLAYISHPEELQKLANIQGPEIAKRLLKTVEANTQNDLIKTLELFYYSHYGSLFSTAKEPLENTINLQQSLMNNEIVLFLFDAASFKRDTSLLGKLVINDINSAFSGLGRQGYKTKAFCIFDEFAAYASSNMSNVLAMQRDNGMHAVIGTQSIHAISEESQQIKRVAVELIANCNTFIIHKINDGHDIELLQNTIGKETSYKLQSISNGVENSTRATTMLKDEYLLDGMAIRALKPGFGYVCQTVAGLKPTLVKFNYI